MPLARFDLHETYEDAEVLYLVRNIKAHRSKPHIDKPNTSTNNLIQINPTTTSVMKLHTYAFLAALAATGMASAQTTAYTTPVGYVTSSPLEANQFNLVSLTVHNPTIAAGVIDAVSSSSVTDTQVDFTSLLTAGQTYILELPSGVIQEVVSWSGGVLTTPDDISGSVVAGTTTYKLRKASTVSDVFGATNAAGLTPSPDGDISIADTIQVFNGSIFETVYYFNDGGGTEGWFDDVGNPADQKVLNYADGFYVKRVAGGTLSLVVSGEVKTKPTSGMIIPGFNYLGAISPVGLTLGNSGLKDFISQSPDGDFSLVDNVLIPAAGGVYQTTYYFNDGGGTEGWFDEFGNPVDTTELASGFLIFNRGVTKPYTVGVPTGYNSL
jgi:hypothetical protein